MTDDDIDAQIIAALALGPAATPAILAGRIGDVRKWRLVADGLGRLKAAGYVDATPSPCKGYQTWSLAEGTDNDASFF